MSDLNRAISIANAAHAGQFDKGGLPYILHPLRVSLSVDGEEAMIVAVLHDVLEDTAVTADDLRREGFSDAVIEAVRALSRRSGESYAHFIARVALNPLAARVKLSDMRDNARIERIANATEKDHARVAKYLAFIEVLEAVLSEDRP